jgi:hypothetical protein
MLAPASFDLPAELRRRDLFVEASAYRLAAVARRGTTAPPAPTLPQRVLASTRSRFASAARVALGLAGA